MRLSRDISIGYSCGNGLERGGLRRGWGQLAEYHQVTRAVMLCLLNSCQKIHMGSPRKTGDRNRKGRPVKTTLSNDCLRTGFRPPTADSYAWHADRSVPRGSGHTGNRSLDATGRAQSQVSLPSIWSISGHITEPGRLVDRLEAQLHLRGARADRTAGTAVGSPMWMRIRSIIG